jgi:hypothetical protein
MKVIKHYIYGYIRSNHLFEKKNILQNCKLALIYYKNDNPISYYDFHWETT